MKNKVMLTAVTCWFLLIPWSIVFSEEPVPSDSRVFQVIGTASVGSAGPSQARDLAVANALASAVSQAAGELLPENGIVKYFPELSRTLLADPKRYVLDYKTPAETSADNIYRAVVQVTVSMSDLKKQLKASGFIRAAKNPPKILFLVSEKSTMDLTPRFWWENPETTLFTGHSEAAMAKIMSDASIPVVSHENLSLGASFPANLADSEAVRIGRGSIAQVFVVGSAWVEAAPNVMGADKKTFKGIISLRALSSESGEIIAQTRQETMVLDSDEAKGATEALSRAGAMAGKALSDQLTQSQSAKGPSEELTLIVEGTGDLPMFVQFRQALTETTGVNGIFVNEMQADSAGILVDYAGTAEKMAEALMVKNFGTFGINIYEITAGQVKIKLVPN